MKEFILGGLTFCWFIFLGLSTLDTLFLWLTFIYPLLLIFIGINIYFTKKIAIIIFQRLHIYS